MNRKRFAPRNQRPAGLKAELRRQVRRQLRRHARRIVIVAIGAGVVALTSVFNRAEDTSGDTEPSDRVQIPTDAPVGERRYMGTVTDVPDGDTVRFQTEGRTLRIRIDSIDAPEAAGGEQRPGQPYAAQSKSHLARWVGGKTLTALCYERDQYGRDVCGLVDAHGESAGSVQVRAGWAWAYTAAQGRYLRDPRLKQLQDEARAARRGLWQDEQVIAPWVWRYDCWQERRCAR